MLGQNLNFKFIAGIGPRFSGANGFKLEINSIGMQ